MDTKQASQATFVPETQLDGSSNVLQDALKACSSITSTALSCRALQRPSLLAQDVAQAIADEQAIAEWLDRKIVEQETLLAHPSADGQSKSAWQRDLFESTARIELERCLLERLSLTPTAKAALVGDKEQAVLIRQALVSREALVESTLRELSRLDGVRQQVAELEAECSELRQSIRALSSSQTAKKDKKSTGLESKNKKEREVGLLKRLMIDLVAVSGIDWNQDDRLCSLMLEMTGNID